MTFGAIVTATLTVGISGLLMFITAFVLFLHGGMPPLSAWWLSLLGATTVGYAAYRMFMLIYRRIS